MDYRGARKVFVCFCVIILETPEALQPGRLEAISYGDEKNRLFVPL